MRDQTIERLQRNLESLESYCQEEGAWCWPPGWLLKEIKDDLIVLDGLRHVKRAWPVWEAFERVDKRIKLQLVLRVSDLIDRARAIYPRESELGKTVLDAMTGNVKAKCSLRDMVLKAENPGQVFWEYRQMVQQRCKAEPLVCWLAEMRHPMAKDFGLKILPPVEDVKAEDRLEHERDNARERQQRSRFRKKRQKKFVRKA